MTTEAEDHAPYAVDRKTLRTDVPILLLLLGDLAYGIYTLPLLPARVPTHWGLSGEPDGWGPAWVNAVAIPCGAIALYALLLYLPLIDPRRESYALFGDAVRFYRWALAVFMVGLHVVLLRVSLGDAIAVDVVVRLGVALLFIALGNRFGQLRQNFFLGIRVPWTLSSEEVWNRTHRAAGRLWVAGGLVLAAAAFLPRTAGVVTFVVTIVILVVVPVFHSWRLYERIVRPRAGGGS